MEALDLLASFAPDPSARDWRGVKFTAFCRELKVELQPGQLALALVAYDGLEPCDLPPELRAIGYRIFGPIEVIPPEARRVLVLVAGARGGKSYVFSALRVLHLALTVDISTMAPGERAFAPIFSGDPRQREQCFRYCLGAAKSHPGIKGMIQGKAGTDDDYAGSEFTLKRKDGTVTVESLPPKAGGGSGRGRSLVVAVLEECAFFQDENHVVNDVDVFTAVTPRILPGGQTILSSTPWAESGLLYEEFVANHPDPRCAAPHLTARGRPHRAIAAHAPTLLLRDVALTREIVAAEEARDQPNASREYGAQFLPLGASQYFDAAEIAQAVDESLVKGAPRRPHSIAAVGADLGFVRDAATGAAVDRTAEGYQLNDYIERIPSLERLKPSEVFEGLGDLAETYGADDIVADQHYAESAREAFDARHMVLIEIPGGNTGKAEIFAAARGILGERQLRLPNDPRLLQQLREVKKRPLPGGGYAIEQPRKSKGGHGDIVSALVAALWWLHKLEVPAVPRAQPSDPIQAEAEAWHERIDRDIAERARKARLEAETGFSHDD